MKTTIKIDRESLTIICNGLAQPAVLVNLSTNETETSIFVELRNILYKRWGNGNEITSLKLYRHSAIALQKALVSIINHAEFGVYENNKMEILKNQLHLKIQSI